MWPFCNSLSSDCSMDLLGRANLKNKSLWRYEDRSKKTNLNTQFLEQKLPHIFVQNFAHEQRVGPESEMWLWKTFAWTFQTALLILYHYIWKKKASIFTKEENFTRKWLYHWIFLSKSTCHPCFVFAFFVKTKDERYLLSMFFFSWQWCFCADNFSKGTNLFLWKLLRISKLKLIARVFFIECLLPVSCVKQV